MDPQENGCQWGQSSMMFHDRHHKDWLMLRDSSTTKVPFVTSHQPPWWQIGESPQRSIPSFFSSVEEVDPICSFSPALEPQDAGNPRIWKIYGDLI